MTVRAATTPAQLATFRVDDLLLGIDVRRIEEVLATQPVVPVPRARDGIIGLVNLRGRIVAAIDARQRLGLTARDPGASCVHVIIEARSGPVSLVVDREGDVVDVDPGGLLEAPVRVDSRIRRLVTGVQPLEGDVLLVLDVDRLVQEGGDERGPGHAGSRH
jgi:purine-binding chemotaxis protein CheW